MREEHLDELTEKALADYFISIAPEPWSAVEVRAVYAQGLALGATPVAPSARAGVFGRLLTASGVGCSRA